jgi:chromosome segregation protein
LRLTSIKLAGFKSFVDPTLIQTPGQRVAIVGPNGCGKSNVIDAVRWVLGESKASALRGESMQDVIFNGAGERKPVGRASVELVFDNSLQRISGAWGQFAEIAIKRVLTREGDSSYYINNQQVRRRDIQDLFMGTGLGPRAYAIIEQGMIARIIEAKPEELRVFLEEAAGVSKYRDRRKETESRLGDAKENLSRVDDIRQELDKQIHKLDAQAKVATEFRSLEVKRVHTQGLLYAVRRKEAEHNAQVLTLELAKVATELEEQSTEAKAHEAELTHLRVSQEEANQALNVAQAAFYESNAQASKLEQQIQFERQRHARAQQDLANAVQRRALLATEQGGLESEIEGTCRLLEERQEQMQTAQETLLAAEAAMPELEKQARDASNKVAEAQSALSQAEQMIQLHEANRQNNERSIKRLDERRARLQDELGRLKGPDAQLKDDLEEAMQAEKESLAESQMQWEALSQDATDYDAKVTEARAEAESAAARLTQLQARQTALANLQDKLSSDNSQGDLGAWLKSHGLSDSKRFWQYIEIDAGFDTAVEGALQERMNAVAVSSLAQVSKHQDPPNRLAVFELAAPDIRMQNVADDALLQHVKSSDATVQALLHSWLSGLRVCADVQTAVAQRAQLAAGEVWVSQNGHVVDVASIRYFRPDALMHGAVARVRELADLEAQITALKPLVTQLRGAAEQAELGRKDHQVRLTQSRGAMGSIERRIHDMELELIQLTESIKNTANREAQINRELQEVAQAVQGETALIQNLLLDIDKQKLQKEQKINLREQLRGGRNEAEVNLNKGREHWRAAERAAQEARFMHRASTERLNDLQRRALSLVGQINDSAVLVSRLEAEMATILLTPIESALQIELDARKGKESALQQARDTLEQIVNKTRTVDEARMRAEQKLEPLRGRQADVALKQQAAQLNVAQFSEQLNELNLDENSLLEALVSAPKASSLASKLSDFSSQIAALGAVNLAALDELKEASERKLYLDTQAEDLSEAMQTLEDAIRKIDRETRQLLLTTYEQVNNNFSRLFPSLFGGGQAKLTLTGEEILEAGVTVLAQPPGKRNTSIHLLSGGEKALTATALVFAFFQLNPAPFCLLDEVDAPLDDANTERFSRLVAQMSEHTQFLFISHNKITMEMAQQLVGITMPEPGVSRMVAVDMEEAMSMAELNAPGVQSMGS